MPFDFRWRGALLGAALPLLAACADEIPTVVADGAFPLDRRASTLQVIVGADALVSDVAVFQGYTEPRDASFAVVANRFDGVLQAHSLLRFTGAPPVDSVVAFGGATLTLRVDTARSVAEGTELRLWTLAQEWDASFVSWERATEATPWREPGGTRGELLGTASAMAQGDSVVFTLGQEAARLVAQGAENPGLLVTAAGEPGRVRINGATLSLAVRLQAQPDSAVTRALVPQIFGFIATPDQPIPGEAFAAGGVQSARTLFRLRLPEQLPACEEAASCGTVPLSAVTVNAASLLLQPVPVPDGYRPLGPTPFVLRRVLEPGLGRQAPLGPIALDQFQNSAGQRTFAAVALLPGDSVVAVPVAQLVRNLAASDSAGIDLALLGGTPSQPVITSFAPAWFAPSPRLRIVYTVPPRPTLP